MTQRALVTGAEGFVGGHLRARFDAEGIDVIPGVGLPNTKIPGAVQFDLGDAESVDDLVRHAAPMDYVVHLAAITFVPDAARSPERVMDINLSGTVRLLDAVQRHAPDARVLFVGSSEAYGPPQSSPITEDHPLAPANPYAISKAAADQYCAYFHAATGLAIVRARPFNHSGSGQADSFVLSSFAKQIAEIESGRREPVVKVGNLEVRRDFSHVEDVVEAYTAMLTTDRAVEAYNVCSGKSVSLQTVLQALFGMIGREVDVVSDPERIRKADIPEVRGSHQKLTADTGWEPKRSIDDILADLLKYWRETLAR